eukprot:2100221-Rhodomonas_salina.1
MDHKLVICGNQSLKLMRKWTNRRYRVVIVAQRREGSSIINEGEYGRPVAIEGVSAIGKVNSVRLKGVGSVNGDPISVTLQWRPPFSGPWPVAYQVLPSPMSARYPALYMLNTVRYVRWVPSPICTRYPLPCVLLVPSLSTR